MARMVTDADDFPGSSGVDVEKREGLSTHFADAVVPTPSMEGDWGGVKGGDPTIGQTATKGAKIPEVTYVDVEGAPARGSNVGFGGSTGGKDIANKE